jgi:signal transduction histidine kinase
LAALARSGNEWSLLRRDPAMVLLLLRGWRPNEAVPFVESLLCRPEPLELAWSLLPSSACPAGLHLDLITASSLHLASMSRALALRVGGLDPDLAWCAGIVAMSGWLALCHLAGDRVSSCFADPLILADPFAVQQRHLGFDISSLNRRLAHQWQIAEPLLCLSRMSFSPIRLHTHNVDGRLLAIVRLAIRRLHEAEIPTGLGVTGEVADDEKLLGLSSKEWLEEPLEKIIPINRVPLSDHPLLADLLRLALENRRLRQREQVALMEMEIDEFSLALREQLASEEHRLLESKLRALAEFAAGAGHEINNPLAVISGQAQYILARSADWLVEDEAEAARKSLETIIAQTKRIHSLLRELMLFARPNNPKPVAVDLPTLLGEVLASHQELASQKQVSLTLTCEFERRLMCLDPEQTRQTLACLVKNALEAAGLNGWVRIVLTRSNPWEIVVQDSGPGPSREGVAHLFDPFYSGRNAGRGRGLGLPIAWRLARKQGGDVVFVKPKTDQPTQFVFQLPRQQLIRDEPTDPSCAA